MIGKPLWTGLEEPTEIFIIYLRIFLLLRYFIIHTEETHGRWWFYCLILSCTLYVCVCAKVYINYIIWFPVFIHCNAIYKWSLWWGTSWGQLNPQACSYFFLWWVFRLDSYGGCCDCNRGFFVLKFGVIFLVEKRIDILTKSGMNRWGKKKWILGN